MVLATSYPDQADGAEAAGGFVADFCNTLSGAARVTVVAPGLQDNLETRGDLAVRRFGVPRLPLSLLSPARPSDWLAIVTTLRKGMATVQETADTGRPDHILALWALPSGHWARRVSRQLGIPYSVWALGSDIWTLSRIPLVRLYLGSTLRNADTCYADGHLLASDVSRLSGRKCLFLPSSRNFPSPPSHKTVTGPPYRLCFLGRWHPNKGIDLLLQSLHMLDEREWARISEIAIFGGGPLAPTVKRAAQELIQLGRPIRIGGYLDKEEAAELFSGSDFLLLPSRIESIPVIFSDAMQAGLPIVGTPVGDLPHLFDLYQPGVLASGVSVDAIREAIVTALENGPEPYTKGMARAAREFSVERAAERFMTQAGY